MSLSEREPPQHAPMDQFRIEGSDLLVGGERLSELAKKMGEAPFYVYDSALIRARVEELRAALPSDLDIHYAMKANPMPDLVRLIGHLVDGIDVASEGEMLVALEKTDFPGDHISFAGPGKRDAELITALRHGVVVNVESRTECERLVNAGKILGIRPKIALRINPDFELKGSGMRMGGGAKPFGIDVEKAPDILRTLSIDTVDFRGFHIFSGSNCLNAQAIIEAQEKTFALAAVLARHAPGPIQTLNIGGGFGIPYFPGEQRLDLTPIGLSLRRQISEVQKILPGVRVNIELGRYLVGESGLYVCRVIDRKESRGQIFLVANGGLHHHLAASGNFGQIIRKNFPVAIGNRMDKKEENETVSIVGPLCTPLDLLADRIILPHSIPGDLVVVFQSGAYGLTASPERFLSHPRAQETLV